jgi:hypothetical protein
MSLYAVCGRFYLYLYALNKTQMAADATVESMEQFGALRLPNLNTHLSVAAYP